MLFVMFETIHRHNRNQGENPKKASMYFMMIKGIFQILLVLPPILGFSISFQESSLFRSFTVSLCSYDARGDYYGESSGSYIIREFSEYEQLEEIVKLAAQPLPERPDGIVTVAKYTSASVDDCRATEAEYERMARSNPATIFLRCFAEYENAPILLGKANVQNWPTFDIFYQGNRVARVEGSNYAELEKVLELYQFQNSQLDLFSEDSKRPWGDGRSFNATKTPRTTARFIPGYDWGSDRGFFDELGDKAAQSFEEQYENWIPPIDDEK